MTILTATQSNFAAQLALMNPGDTLQVSGPFSGRPDGRKFSSLTTIDFRQAQVSDFYTSGWGGVVMLGGQASIGQQFNVGIRLEGSSDVRLSGFQIDGTTGPKSGWDSGIWMRGCSNIVAELITVTGGQMGIFGSDIANFSILSAVLREIVGDGIQVADCPNLLIDSPIITGLRSLAGDHPDAIQIRRSVGKPVVVGTTVRKAQISDCDSQGIFIVGDDDGPAFDQATVSDCNIEAGYVNGILLSATTNGQVLRNSLRTRAGSPWQSLINPGGNKRSGNIVAAYTQPDGTVKPEIRDPDYVAPAPAPSPAPTPTSSPAPAPAPSPAPSPAPAPKPAPTPTAKPPADVTVNLKKGQRLIVTGAASAIITGAS